MITRFLLILTLLVTCLGAQASSLTTAQRLALNLGPAQAGAAVWDTDLSSQMWWTGTEWVGYPVGVPFVRSMSTNRIGIVAGSVRQRASDRTKWDFVRGTDRAAVGVSGDYGVASGYDLTITFDRSYSKVITCLVAPNAALANVAALSVGASVGLSSISIRASAYYNGSFVVYWDGASWQIGSGAGQNITPAVSSYANGLLTITHKFCQGIGATATPWTRSGVLFSPLIPALGTVGNSSLTLQWLDPLTGATVTNGPTTGMAASVTKVNSGGLPLDGTSSAIDWNGIDPAAVGEIFFFGIFQE